MMMMSPPSPKSSATTGVATSVAGTKTGKQSSGASKSAKKRYIPKQYPKPTLAELALLVGDIAPTPPATVQKPLPYELKWRENGAELSLHAANQGFIATQMARLQTHIVQPMVSVQVASVMVSSAVTTEDTTTLAEDATPQVLDTEAGLLPDDTMTVPLPQSAIQEPLSVLAEVQTVTNQLAALLALPVEEEAVYPSEVIEQPVTAIDEEEIADFEESIELEFVTPVEAGLASYLGVSHSSTVTISVEHEIPRRPQVAVNTATAPLSNDEYFSQALEAELAAQKAWLAQALEREQQKAYPHKRLNALPTPQACVEEQQALVSLVNQALEEEDVVSEPILLSDSEVALDFATEVVEEPVTTTAADANEQDFAAVLESLMEDFTETSQPTEEAGEEEPFQPLDLLEDTAETVTDEAVLVTEKDEDVLEVFEVVGIQPPDSASAVTVEPSEPEAEQQPTMQVAELTEADTQLELGTETTPPTFTQLLKRTKAETPLELLLLSAWFLKEYEQQTTFSLRKLNHLLASVSKPNANHTVLELAISKHYVTLIPDLTGKATTTEYQLSKAGENAAVKLIQVLQ
jgi:hypothetical protein